MPETQNSAKVVTRDSDRDEQLERQRKRRRWLEKERNEKKKPQVEFTTEQKVQVRSQVKRLEALKSTQRKNKFDGPASPKSPTKRKRRFALLPPPPGMKEDRPGANKTPPEIDGAMCLVHGMKAQFVGDALRRGKLSSAYSRLGPEGDYFRKDDRNGGGASAVYTRAYGVEHTSALAHGYGVGSDPLSCVQFVMSPTILQDEKHIWRASTSDRKGKLPGVTPKELLRGHKLDPQQMKQLWEKQSPSDRARAFNDTIHAPPPSKPGEKTGMTNNEQTHYQALPLENCLKAIVASSKNTFDELMQLPGAHLDPDNPPHGIVMMGDKPIRVLRANETTKLRSLLEQQGIADPKTGQVR